MLRRLRSELKQGVGVGGPLARCAKGGGTPKFSGFLVPTGLCLR